MDGVRLIADPEDHGDREEELQKLIAFAAATGAAVFLPGCDVVEPAAGSAYSDHDGGSGADPPARGSRRRD